MWPSQLNSGNFEKIGLIVFGFCLKFKNSENQNQEANSRIKLGESAMLDFINIHDSICCCKISDCLVISGRSLIRWIFGLFLYLDEVI